MPAALVLCAALSVPRNAEITDPQQTSPAKIPGEHPQQNSPTKIKNPTGLIRTAISSG
jgi:hypothetical protein